MGWTTHQDDKTLKDYISELITFLKCLIAMENKPADYTGYRLPTTDSQKAMIKRLNDSLTDNKKDIGLIHDLFYSFTAPPDEETPVGKWHETILCYIAASNVHAMGGFKPVTDVTGQLAKWEYLIRGGCFREIVKEDSTLRTMDR
jgi:hypothetical protein